MALAAVGNSYLGTACVGLGCSELPDLSLACDLTLTH